MKTVRRSVWERIVLSKKSCSKLFAVNIILKKREKKTIISLPSLCLNDADSCSWLTHFPVIATRFTDAQTISHIYYLSHTLVAKLSVFSFPITAQQPQWSELQHTDPDLQVSSFLLMFPFGSAWALQEYLSNWVLIWCDTWTLLNACAIDSIHPSAVSSRRGKSKTEDCKHHTVTTKQQPPRDPAA